MVEHSTYDLMVEGLNPATKMAKNLFPKRVSVCVSGCTKLPILRPEIVSYGLVVSTNRSLGMDPIS